MRLRFFNTYEPVTTFYRDLLPHLAAQGFQVEVFISAAEYRSGRGSLKKALQEHPNIKITQLPAAGVLPTGRIQKTWVMIAYMICASFASLFASQVEINFFLTQPPLFALWGWVLKRVRGQRHMILLMDIYPDIAVKDGLLSKEGFLVRVLSGLSRFSWRVADEVVVIGRCMQERLAKAGIPKEKIHFIPNWINERVIFPVVHRQNPIRHELRLDDKFIVLYSGNMGVSHEFLTILQAVESLRSQKSIAFVFIGDGAQRAFLEQTRQQTGLDNLRLLPFQPEEHLAESLSMGDVHLVSLREGFEGLAVPSKAYSAMGAERPIIYVGHPAGEIARMVREENIGTVIQPGDGEALARAIQFYAENKEERITQSSRALEVFRERYSRENALKAYTALFLKGNHKQS